MSIKKQVIIIIILVLALILFFASTTIVPTGHIGVVTLYSKVQDIYLDAGFHFIKPFVESVHDVDIRTQKYENTVETSSKDLQIVNVTMSINYQIKAEKVSELYANVGTDYANIILNPALQSSLKGTIANYTAEEMVTKRTEVANSITNDLNERLGEYFTISAVNLENIGFTDAFNEAVETKTTNQQKAEAEEAQLEIIRIQNQEDLETAQTEAQIRALEAQSITETTLKEKELEVYEKWIEKWNGTLPTTMLEDSSNLLYSLGE